jgi:hypothetical protein
MTGQMAVRALSAVYLEKGVVSTLAVSFSDFLVADRSLIAGWLQ